MQSVKEREVKKWIEQELDNGGVISEAEEAMSTILETLGATRWTL